MNPIIQAEDLTFSYSPLSVLSGVNLAVEKGEFIGLIGPNGGGKTTLLKLVMGFLRPTAGSLQVLGCSPEKARLRMGYVPQVHRMDRSFPITVRELVLLGALERRSLFGKDRLVNDEADALLEEMGLSEYEDRPFASLSGGLAQRALFTRALLSRPELLLLDEPTANVDISSTQQILQKLDEIKGETTILLVTHDLSTIVERVDRILSVRGCVHSFHPKEICEHFALGLYHTPLAGLPKDHLIRELKEHVCLSH
jgi:zinc transport system ATP-binding protein